MEKFKKWVQWLVIVIIVLGMGILIGSQLENTKQEGVQGNLYNSNEIAVVNLDEGTLYQNQQINYAKTLIENYKGNYVLSGLSDAQAGIKEGRYAAYVIIPSDFSTNFVSVNTVPKKSVLKYEISGNLSQTANDQAWQEVMALKEQINDDVGYVYISSVLGEFHNGQDEALKVLENDARDKEILDAISNLDLVATLDLREVERIENNIQALDVDPDIAKNEEIMDAIDIAYKGYLSESMGKFEGLKTDATNVQEDNANVKTASEAIKTLINEDGSKNYKVDTLVKILEDYNTGLQAQVGDVEESLTNAKKDGKDSVDAYIEGYVKDREAALDALMIELQASHSELSKKQWSDLETELETLFSEDTITTDWDTYEAIGAVFDAEREKEQVTNAQNYIDKTILNQLDKVTFPIADIDTFTEEMLTNTAGDTKLSDSLKVYATSIGKSEEDIAIYSLRDYIESNANVVNGLPALNDTSNTNELEENLKVAFTIDVADKLAEIQTGIKEQLTTWIGEQSETTLDDKGKVEEYKKGLALDMPIVDTTNASLLLKEISLVSTSDAQSGVDEDLLSLAQEQETNKLTLLQRVENHSQYSSLFNENLFAFDPLEDIDENEIERFVWDYESNNRDMQYKIEDKSREYQTFTLDSYDNANEQVRSMSEDVQKYQTQSDEKVNSGLENAKRVRNDTAAENTEIMESFIGKLAYTRNGTIENDTVYDFMVTSSTMEGSKASVVMDDVKFDYMKLVISFMIGSVVVLGGVYLFAGIKGRKKATK